MAAADQKPAPEPGTAAASGGDAGQPPVPALRAPDPEPAPPDGRRRRRWPLMLTAAVLVGLGLLAYALPLVAPRLAPWAARAPRVAVEIATLAPVTRVLAVNGRIAAVHSVDVRSVATGSLSALLVAEGDKVTANQLLARVDAGAQTAILRQAVAALDAALVAQEQARESHARALALGDNVARSVLDTEARAVRSAAQEVARAGAVLDQARAVLDTHAIRAPVAGSVVRLDVEQGQVVGPATALLTLADLSDLVVEADVDEAYATQIAIGQPVVMQLAGETGTRDGHVSFVASRVDIATGGLAIKIAFDAPVSAPIGLTVATNIIVERRDAALTVPRTALLSGEAGSDVLVVSEGVAQRRPVGVVDWPAARLLVTSGLAEGDAVIIDAAGLRDGQAVTPEQP